MEEQPKAPSLLAPPAVSSLRAGKMERSLSENIREEREDLREAAEQTLNVIMDLNLDGTIRWVSPSWVDVVGTQPEEVTGTAIADLIVSDNKSIFADVIESMQRDDSKSKFIRFAVKVGPLSRLLPLESAEEPTTIDVEAQGIMVYDGASGKDSHVSEHRSCFTRRTCVGGTGNDLCSCQFILTPYFFVDHVDDQAVGSTSGDQNRSTSLHRRIPRLGG